MKKVFCTVILSLMAIGSLAAQKQNARPEYFREIAAGGGVLFSNHYGAAVPTYTFQAARFQDWGGGVRTGVNYAEIPYRQSMFVSVPIHLALRFDIPWFVGFDIFDDFFWTLAMESETFEQSLFFIVAGAIVSVLPKRIEIDGGISPGYVLGNSNDIADRTYYTGDVMTRDGFACSADLGLRATAKMGRLGLFIAPVLSWQLTPSLYYHDNHYDEHRLFCYYSCGLTFAF